MYCSHCGVALPDDQVAYCPQCGASTKQFFSSAEPARVDVKAFVEETLRNGKSLSISSCLARSWSLVCSDYWTFFGVTFVATLCLSIPILSFIILGGMSYYYLGKIRRQHRELADIFVGFRRQTLQLILVGIVQSAILVGLYLIFAGIVGFMSILSIGFLTPRQPAIHLHFNHLELPPQVPNVNGMVFGVLGMHLSFVLLLYLIIIGLALLWFFSYHLTMDRNLQFWDAMEISRRVISKHFFSVLGLTLTMLILSMAGMCFCYIGIFFVAPFLWAAWSYAYEDLFGGTISSDITVPVTT
ncbi:MAG: zinc ribbon domain-containing protein [Planctomycetaceae bacterium]|jgi:hypothetical protein|nr:zinc ribbon domain-containing protein [Planctomycetaceae bacterium]